MTSTPDEGPFTRRAAIWIAALAGASLATAGLLGVFGGTLWEPPTFGADAWSRSAVGHRAYLELLRGLGVPVLTSRHRTGDKAREGAVVALLEPHLGPEGGARSGLVDAIRNSATRLLVVLPKRAGTPDPVRPRWLGSATIVAASEAQGVLSALHLDAEVVRPARSVGRWRGALPPPSIDEPQLLRSRMLEPLLETDEGILAGELVDEDAEGDERHVVVLADPDVLATHGLGRGDNAVIAVRLAERLGAGSIPLVVDETLHGYEEQPSLARELLRFPLVFATIQALLAAALLAWTALVRFGRPRPPAPALSAGKGVLVEHGAELLRHGGHVGDALEAYLRAAKDEVLARLHPGGDTASADAWLARIAAARGQDEVLRDLEERTRKLARTRRGGELETLRITRAIHRWREEMTDGAAGDPRRDRAAAG